MRLGLTFILTSFITATMARGQEYSASLSPDRAYAYEEISLNDSIETTTAPPVLPTDTVNFGIAAGETQQSHTLATVLTAKDAAPFTNPKPQFIPNPQRALWLALLLPGAGQIYNRKYWKLPIFYGGILGCVYAFSWNQQMYLDYSQAYLDIMDDDPGTKSYEAMLPYNYNIAANTSRLQTLFKKKKDYYRRYRDLSAFCFAGVYLLSVIDAYVDAQLSEFSISDDLTMSVSPAVIENAPNTDSHSYGVGCSINF